MIHLARLFSFSELRWQLLNWLSLCLAYALAVLAYLPYGAMIFLGRQIGKLIYYCLRYRRHIAAVNIALCFPEKTKAAQKKLLWEHFLELGITLLETNFMLWRPITPLLKRCDMIGDDAMRLAQSEGHGILVIGAHYTTLDLAGALVASDLPLSISMRRLKNPVFNRLLYRARCRYYQRVMQHTELKKMLVTLKSGGMLWYAPDQDYGLNNSVFVPFFGQLCASLKITPKLVARTNAKVFFAQITRNNGRYRIQYHPLVVPFPTQDLAKDVALINRYLEHYIRRNPAQYFWIHRRFKTMPHRKKAVLYKKICKVNKKEVVVNE